MRGKRSKQYRKLMQQYALSFGFREPYQVLVDASMIQDAMKFKMDLVANLEKSLHGRVKPMITQCSMRHLYATGDQGIIAQAKEYERRRCSHHELDEPLSTFDCIRSVVDPKDTHINKHRYVGAIQDLQTRSYLRQVLGVPLIYIHRSVMIMEPMTIQSEQHRSTGELNKFRTGIKAQLRAQPAKRKHDEVDESPEKSQAGPMASGDAQVVKKRRNHGPKAPNPLSMKKPKTRNELQSGEDIKARYQSLDNVSTQPVNESSNLSTISKLPSRRKRKSSNWKSGIVDKVLVTG